MGNLSFGDKLRVLAIGFGLCALLFLGIRELFNMYALSSGVETQARVVSVEHIRKSRHQRFDVTFTFQADGKTHKVKDNLSIEVGRRLKAGDLVGVVYETHLPSTARLGTRDSLLGHQGWLPQLWGLWLGFLVLGVGFGYKFLKSRP